MPSKYTEEETQYIIEHYPTKGAKTVAKKLNKSVFSICAKAQKLNLMYKIVNNDEGICKTIWCNRKAVNRGFCNICASRERYCGRMTDVGNIRKKRFWTIKEISILKERYPIVGAKGLFKVFDRPETAISTKARRLGIKYIAKKKYKQCRSFGCSNMCYANDFCAFCYRLYYNYSMSFEEYNKIFTFQNGVCGICGNPEKQIRRGKIIELAVDHDPITGMIRGLLCSACNRGIGKLGDNLAIIIYKLQNYLVRDINIPQIPRKKYSKAFYKRRNRQLISLFGINYEEYLSLLDKQKNVCAICKQPETWKSESGKIADLAVDHVHGIWICKSCGYIHEKDEKIIKCPRCFARKSFIRKIRGLVCIRCNSGLCLLGDNVQNSINNLIRYKNNSRNVNALLVN